VVRNGSSTCWWRLLSGRKSHVKTNVGISQSKCKVVSREKSRSQYDGPRPAPHADVDGSEKKKSSRYPTETLIVDTPRRCIMLTLPVLGGLDKLFLDMPASQPKPNFPRGFYFVDVKLLHLRTVHDDHITMEEIDGHKDGR